MNIGHCIHGLGLGGAQQVIKLIARRSAAAGFRHYVYSCDDGVLRGEVERAGATVRIIPRRVPKLDPLWAAALGRAMRADRIDVVHTHLFGDSLHGYLGARLAGGLPVVMTLHISTDGLTRVQRAGYRWLLSRAAHVVACTRSAAASFAPATARAGIRLETIPNGVELPARLGVANVDALKARFGIAPQLAVIAGIGRLAEQKGFTYLIEAFAALCRRTAANSRLVLFGDGPLRTALAAHAQQAGIADRVCFAGFRDDIGQLFPAFDLVVFSSLYEGLSMALLETMAAARCIVATAAPGLIDALDHEREALLVPVRDAAALAIAMQSALADPCLRQRLGQVAQQRFHREFTAERMAASYTRVYDAVYARAYGAPSAAIAWRAAGGSRRV